MKTYKEFLGETKTWRDFYVWGNKKGTKTGVIRGVKIYPDTDRQEHPSIYKRKWSGDYKPRTFFNPVTGSREPIYKKKR